MMKCCETCAYWMQRTEYECHRRAPVAFPVERDYGCRDKVVSSSAYWPVTHHDDYCGDYEVKAALR